MCVLVINFHSGFQCYLDTCTLQILIQALRNKNVYDTLLSMGETVQLLIVIKARAEDIWLTAVDSSS